MKLNLFNKLVNDVKKSKFVQEFMKKLSDQSKKVKNEKTRQFNNVENNKQENCLYRVIDFGLKGIFLQNTKNNKIFEENAILKELIDKIGNDSILRYKNGQYIYEEKLTDDFFNKLVDINEYRKLQKYSTKKFYKNHQK